MFFRLPGPLRQRRKVMFLTAEDLGKAAYYLMYHKPVDGCLYFEVSCYSEDWVNYWSPSDLEKFFVGLHTLGMIRRKSILVDAATDVYDSWLGAIRH